MEHNKYVAKIFGQEYTFLTDADESKMKKLTSYVDNKIWKTFLKIKGNKDHRLYIMTALDIAQECFEAASLVETVKREKEALKEEVTLSRMSYDELKELSDRDKEVVSNLRELLKLKEAEIQEIEQKREEYENSYFELQMENIKLKNSLNEKCSAEKNVE